jgi:DNA helicase II / ATP-dependent DNA helicase PcrA
MPGSFEELNEQQREAVRHQEGPLLVHAPVGTGKTTVLAHRAAFAIAAGRDPASLLCLSFTNRAARQMRERITELLKGQATDVSVRTFHGFCTHVLRLEAENVGLPHDFSICDEADAREVLLDAWRQQRGQATAPERLADVLSRVAKRLKQPGAVIDDPEGLLVSLAEEAGLDDLSCVMGLDPVGLVEEYNARLAAGGALDFDDIIARVHRLLTERPDRLAWWQRTHPWVQVDEVQDTTPAEYDILARLALESRNLGFFGDLDQTIYEWRGSRPWDLLSDFERRFVPLRQIELTRNYRSSQHILEACVAVIRKCERSVTRTIECVCPDAGDRKVFLRAEQSPQSEARWIAKSIHQIVKKHGVPRSQIAILVRTNQHAIELSDVLASQKVEHFRVEKVSFFRQAEIKDALALVRFLLNPLDSQSLRRVLGRGTLGVPASVIDEVRQMPPEVGLRLADLVDPLTHEELDPYGLLLRRLDEGRVVLFDTETTGLDVTRDDVIELAALRMDASSELGSLEMLLKTDRPLEEAARVHGITAEALALAGREPAEGLRQFLDWGEDCVLVGHNVSFDVNLVRSQLRRLGVDWSPPRSFDTLELARRLLSLPRYTLRAIVQALELSVTPTHRAMADVRATWLLLQRLLPALLSTRPARQEATARFSGAFRLLARRVEKWRRLAEKERPIFTLNRLLDESGLLEHWRKQDGGTRRVGRLHELAQLFGQYDDLSLPPREALLNLTHLAALGNEMDRYLESEDKVLLLTAHQAKGLEFDTVFIAGATDRQFPSSRSVREGRVSEEHRLFYVAMTRARSRLIISYHEENGEGKRQGPSRFLDLLPPEACQDLP